MMIKTKIMKTQPRKAITVDTTWPKEKLMVIRTSYPNGEVLTYPNGRERYELLQSNDPLVLAEAKRRIPVKNTFKKPRTLVQEAAVIIDMASTKLRRAKG
jgi:hypothetical protein